MGSRQNCSGGFGGGKFFWIHGPEPEHDDRDSVPLQAKDAKILTCHDRRLLEDILRAECLLQPNDQREAAGGSLTYRYQGMLITMMRWFPRTRRSSFSS